MRFLWILLLLLVSMAANGYNLRQYSSKNGLSNSAILSMYQDKDGIMWFGTCEGLNTFNGVNFKIYTNSQNNIDSKNGEKNKLSGNIIGEIIEADNNVLWVKTNYGLDRFDSRKRTIHSYKEFKGEYKLIKSRDNKVYIINEDNYLYYYEPSDETFRRIFIEDFVYNNMKEAAIDMEGKLWLVSGSGEFRIYTLKHESDVVDMELKDRYEHKESILYCTFDQNVFYFINSIHDLYEYNANSGKEVCIENIRKEVLEKGEISSILKYYDDYFIGFKSSGLIRLQSTQLKTRFFVSEIDIKSGIFCLKKDRFQDIIWVGTDGQGVFMYYVNQYTIKSTLFPSPEYPISNPVRALFIDDDRTLWIGTKGDGIIRTENYNVLTNLGERKEHLLSSNSKLKDNSVYAFAKSVKNILWIGTELGVNYYSYKDKKIKSLDFIADGKTVRYVHAICEINDSTLWVATVGEGIVKASLSGSADEPVISKAERIANDNTKVSTNYFFTAYQENDSIIWFGNRGYGAYKINSITHNMQNFNFDQNETNQTLNDIFAIVKTNNDYWFGTSYGLAHLADSTQTVFNESNGLLNNTIHGMLADKRDNLWLSTNQGIVEFNTERRTFRTYKLQNEFEVSEFSDGAGFKDPDTNILFFGGVNGYISIVENEYTPQNYEPPIQFNQLSIFGKEYNFYEFINKYRGEDVLQLNHSQNFFSLAFTAIDYINGNDFTYFYKMNEVSDKWINNGTSNAASFTNISPGNYKLEVKYLNNITGEQSEVSVLNIHVLSPWYSTRAAIILYCILGTTIIVFIVGFSINWYSWKKKNLENSKREEVYESKLRFFTNITHELCTPLTLISGPCEKIISNTGIDNNTKKYAELIRYNAEKLSGLIQELIDFRRLETGNESVDIKRISVSNLIRNVAESFTESAENKEYDYTIDVEKDVMWNSDSGCLSKIVTNLISNAFKYTSEKGTIGVKLFVEDNKLFITVSNTGKGIKNENISKIFDRYTILDNFELESKNGFPQRNGLGLAICNHMVKLLEGEIQVASVLNEVTVFTVVLPQLKNESASPALDKSLPPYNKSKKTIMIVDDEASMLWFIAKIFMDDYNVIPISDPKDVLPLLKEKMPDLIISDVMMPGIDGISLLKSIKNEKLLKHIPFILLSAKNDSEEQVKGIESGAEAYVTKPFAVGYLETVVSRILNRKEELKEYYASPLSSFELNEGKLTHIEDQQFVDKLLRVIKENISNPDLSAEALSSLLQVSVRQLYRKAKEITSKTPNEIIKEQRLLAVERLLISTNLSVEEIMYKAGFHNKGHFFKVFSKRFGATPKGHRESRKSEITLP